MKCVSIIVIKIENSFFGHHQHNCGNKFRRKIFVKPILDASGECMGRPGSSSSGADFEPSFSDSVLSRGSSPFSDCAFKTDCSSPESTASSRSARVALVKFHFF